MEKAIKKKVQAMSAKEVIMLMVEGLRHPTTKVDMRTFGKVEDGVCFGCAATNAICRLGNITADELIQAQGYADEVKGLSQADKKFIPAFEIAIDSLRQGNIVQYNKVAKQLKIAHINFPAGKQFSLPYLSNEFTEKQLLAYEKLANLQ